MGPIIALLVISFGWDCAQVMGSEELAPKQLVKVAGQAPPEQGAAVFQSPANAVGRGNVKTGANLGLRRSRSNVAALAALLIALPFGVAALQTIGGQHRVSAPPVPTIRWATDWPTLCAWSGYLVLLGAIGVHLVVSATPQYRMSTHLGMQLLFGALVLMMTAPRFPILGPLAYILVSYAFPRHDAATVLVMRLNATSWLTLLSLASVAVMCVRERRWPVVPRTLFVFALCALMVWIGLVVLAAVMDGRPLTPYLTHRTTRFLEAFVLLVVMMVSGIGLADLRLLAFSTGTALIARQYWFPDDAYMDNNLAMLIVIAIPLVVGAAVTAPSRLAQVLFVVIGVRLAYLVVLIENRGAAVGLIVAMLVLWACSRHRWRIAVVAVPLLLLAAGWLASSGLVHRFGQAYQDGQFRGSAASRIELWKAGWRMFQDHWMWGVGPENFALYARQYNPEAEENSAHNIFLDMFAETGVVGGTLYVVLLGLATVGLARMALGGSILPARDWRRVMAAAILASLWAHIVAGCFLSIHSLVLIYCFLGAGLVLSSQSVDHVYFVGEGFWRRRPRWLPRVFSGKPVG